MGPHGELGRGTQDLKPELLLRPTTPPDTWTLLIRGGSCKKIAVDVIFVDGFFAEKKNEYWPKYEILEGFSEREPRRIARSLTLTHEKCNKLTRQ